MVLHTLETEFFYVSNNLLQGDLPLNLFSCNGLKIIDLSNNGLGGSIPTEVGYLVTLREIKFHQNALLGSIPNEIFDASRIEVLMLQSNRLTGSIPTQVGNLENATHILLNHNELKGAIPNELTDLKQILYLHLHHNLLTGKAPPIKFTTKHQNNYISDCGDPSYLLPKEVECKSCTMCCNSEDECQEQAKWHINISTLGFLFTFSLPIGIGIFAYYTKKMSTIPFISYFKDLRDPVYSYKDDSVYCFILSSNSTAWLVYLLTAGVQIGLFATFLGASSESDKFSDNSFPFICPNNKMDCEPKDSNVVARSGWILFFIVMTIYLGSDIVMSMLQIRKATALLDFQLYLSGFGLLSLTILTFFTSFVYNLAFVERNADLVINAVILLFINDLDERVMSAFKLMLPEWTEKRLAEIERKMVKKKTQSVIEYARSKYTLQDPDKKEGMKKYDEVSINQSEEDIGNHDEISLIEVENGKIHLGIEDVRSESERVNFKDIFPCEVLDKEEQQQEEQQEEEQQEEKKEEGLKKSDEISPDETEERISKYDVIP